MHSGGVCPEPYWSVLQSPNEGLCRRVVEFSWVREVRPDADYGSEVAAS
jgi:hypothetical protein